MGERIAWVTDSTSCLDEQLQNRNDLFIVPMVVIIDGREYEDGINILPNDIAQIMKNTSSIPTTSQPSIGTFTELYKKLEQLHRSGRLSSAKYILGSLLKLKPIISIQKGVLETKAKARSELKAENRIFEWYRSASESIRECCILYGSTPEQAGRWREKILSITPDIKVHIYPLGSAISVHTGAETLGISWFNEK